MGCVSVAADGADADLQSSLLRPGIVAVVTLPKRRDFVHSASVESRQTIS